jgi:steroid delta-isomerase-like uncharacterized protein
LTTEATAALFARRQNAWARRDLPAFLADYSEDCVVESPTVGTLTGRAAIEQAERRLWTVFPDITVEREDLVIADDRVVLSAIIRATDHDGRLIAAGKELRFPAVVLYTIHDGRIVRERRIWDFSRHLLERVQRDLNTAAEIQQLLLPGERYRHSRFDLAARSVPCRALGGDFFDHFDLPDGQLAFTVGDVAGKGPPAALLGALVQGSIAAFGQSAGPAVTLRQANRALARRGILSRFATVIYATLSVDGSLTYCNAGHNPPLVVGPAGTRRLQGGGMVLGLFEDALFEEVTLQIQPGDVIVCFSDGITEAVSATGEEFGEERLIARAQANLDLVPAAIVDGILQAVQEFTAGTKPHDDLTVLVLKYI